MKEELHAWAKRMNGMTTGTPAFYQKRLEELEQLLEAGAGEYINEPDEKGVHVLTRVARAYKYRLHDRYKQADPIIHRLREAGAVWLKPEHPIYSHHYRIFEEMAWSQFQLH
ncbi:hypothetical protein [Stenotrophomonas maltophilia]|uniref:hypothetical protein n=1 Tax=Stenotrophomonas maltophilia TaxID=40324 RepID=UPI0012FE5BC0|nr:hypothetical protein [Stenotrophomonas maltophilia]